MNLEEAKRRIADLENELEMKQLLADFASEAIAVFDDEMRCIAANVAIVEVLGYTPDEIVGLSALDFVAEEYHEIVAENIGKRLDVPYFVMGKRKDGSSFPAEARGETLVRQGRKLRVAAMRDISFIRSTQVDLQAALQELETIFSSSKVGLMFLQSGRFLKKANQTLADILGYASPDEMLGFSMLELHLSEERYIDFGERYFNTLASGAQLNVEYQLRRKDGSPVWCSLSGQAVDKGKPVDLTKGVLWVVDDISHRKAAEGRLMKMATTDDLTGALNRKEFFRQVEISMAQEKRCPSGPSIMMVDLDHFKDVNDHYGHEAGDAVLRSFARTCREVLRDEDLFARLGGEEFAIFLPGADLGGAIAVGERLRARFASTYTTTPVGNIQCTVSVGVAGTSSRSVKVGELLRRADEALYEAKDEGRDRVVFHD